VRFGEENVVTLSGNRSRGPHLCRHYTDRANTGGDGGGDIYLFFFYLY